MRKARTWWRARWMDVSMGVYYSILIAVGLVGIHDPSASLERFLGLATVLYTVGLVLMGSLALMSVVLRSRDSERAALIVLALLTVVHGAIIMQAGAAGFQTGLRLVAAPFGGLVLANLRAQTTHLRKDEIAKHVVAAEAAARLLTERERE